MDLTSERTPDESGLTALIHPNGRDFVGRAALFTRRSETARRDSVLLEIEDAEFAPFYAHTLYQGDRIIGTILTTAAFDPQNTHLKS